MVPVSESGSTLANHAVTSGGSTNTKGFGASPISFSKYEHRSQAAKVMDGAIDLAMEGRSPYPKKAAFIDATRPRLAMRSSGPLTRACRWCSSLLTAALGFCVRTSRLTRPAGKQPTLCGFCPAF